MTDTVQHELDGANGAFKVVVLGDRSDQPNPACAMVYGDPVDGCPVRVHSRCLYGEIFEATTCDCLFQLRMSQKVIRDHGSGVLIYLDQEGRGEGLLAKAEGYRLCQKTGIDTFDAYAELGYKADSRSYADAVALLKHLGLKEISLLTNNPAKWEALALAGIKVRQQPLIMPEPGDLARAYLAAKELQGHMFSLTSRRRRRMDITRKVVVSSLTRFTGRSKARAGQ
ncbi:GTP cyclohydrolase II RibA [Amycolatopsis australiensis]|uniref:GTP cyclohydrolase II n=1 Tax=Amycolatopsis australiensis TaxID=546364 RepID=A0A1K1RG53_9PSEU|nr:GTP cyclohydrolase II RibA [Amycolatopsis australiensis]SFW70844.1 GTP cyclohydrolase II [Amycolatopsis australiensis]